GAAGVGCCQDGGRRERRRHEDHRGVCAGLLDCILHGVEHRPAFVRRAALARSHAADDVRPIGLRLLRMKRALAAGEALDDETRRFINQYCHMSVATNTRSHEDRLVFPRETTRRAFVSSWRRYPASSTTFFAASSIASAVVKFMPLSCSRRLPSSTLVPSMRMTIGTGTPSSFTAAITPCASTSQRRMPPKMLISTAFTFLSDIRILNALRICSALAPPPTSRKLAGSPPASLMMSMVAIARPAPFTMQPMLPSRWM